MDIEQLIKSHDFGGTTIVMTGEPACWVRDGPAPLVRSGANVAILARIRPGRMHSRIAWHRVLASAILVRRTFYRRNRSLKPQEDPGRVRQRACTDQCGGGNAPGATTPPNQRFFDLPRRH